MKTKTLTPFSHGAPHHCFGCGETNHSGLRLKFFVDQQKQVVCNTRLAPRFAGPPGHAHGGIIATLLDEAMSKSNRVHDVVAMTRQMEVEYLRPVPLGVPIMLIGRRTSHDGHKNYCEAEIVNQKGAVLARSKALFIAVDRRILKLLR
ncbi:PaaI family thioesterase [Alloacidobacterium sp.]|uniref:PaaI family thioesterase n=1 Tax=Alloacidobacterium sp. TaxID=2951999 RepID=UPI002D4C4DB6|nr:PaaI family thioesterase [Alloacidobacterium sp.]HYK34447.1 PaaI family thioesterase [Alloacidobacterium sp.]